MAKYLIIFGAGASHGADDKNLTPPLGGDLFDVLTNYNPTGWGQINGELANKFRIDFEAGMIELSQKQPHALPPLQRVLSAYFFNFVPRSTNLYYLLAQRINKKNWDGAMITLNYERLLELSLLATGIQPFIGTSSPNNNKTIELCLPHGCCHLFCESVRGSAGAVSFAGMNISTNGPISVISDQLEFQNRIQTDAFPPVMSYFEPSKRTTSGNNFILAQRLRFSELVKNASIIILIGIRVREHDKHIWESLGQTDAKLVYISGETAKQEFETWKNKTRSKKEDIVLDGYFKDSFDTILKQVDL